MPDDEDFVARVNAHLRRQGDIETYFWSAAQRAGSFRPQLDQALAECDALVFFLGTALGETQEDEWDVIKERARTGEVPRVVVQLPDPYRGAFARGFDRITVPDTGPESAESTAKRIVKLVGRSWTDWDVPLRYPFDYEKDIIDHYRNTDKPEIAEKLRDEGCSPEWPAIETVERRDDDRIHKNPVLPEIIGNYRDDDARIVVDARAANGDGETDLTFNEAGPRRLLRYPLGAQTALRVGILVSGGIAPGINAVIAGVVARHELYWEKARERPAECKPHGLTIYGYPGGFNGLSEGNRVELFTGDPGKQPTIAVEGHAQEGGSLLTTARAEDFFDPNWETREEFMRNVLNSLRNIDILYVIGGDGSMRAAHAIWTAAKSSGSRLSVVGIPKTMDNDILWIWQSFGFLSAVDRAKEAILHLHTEVKSNPRLCIIQLFGSDSGFVVSHAALASGVPDLVLIPEVPFQMEKVSEYIFERLKQRFKPEGAERPYGVILMSETAIPKDVMDYVDEGYVRLYHDEKEAIRRFVDEENCRVRGQTPDELRTGGLKVVSRVLERWIREEGGREDSYWKDFRVLTNEPRHLIRAIPPSVADVSFAQRLGTLAVDNAMAGYTDFMVSQWLTEYVLVPLKLVVLGRKRVPDTGIFWKTVLANTEQPPSLV
jgi:6-phosphofructokinase 1